jgi:hypothetical protein
VTLSFPRTMPSTRFSHARFKLIESVTASPSGGGRINYSETNDATWAISFQAPSLRESQLAELDAWWMSLRGGLRGSLVQQNVTCRPFAHATAATAAPAQDPGNLVSVANGNELSINGVLSTLVLQPGDLIGLEYGGFYGLGRITEVSGTGTTRTIAIEPRPRSYVAVAGAVVRFENPKLLMRPMPGSWSVTDGGHPTASFSLVESKT